MIHHGIALNTANIGDIGALPCCPIAIGVLDVAIFRNVTLSAIASWTFIGIIARGHHKVFSVDECEKRLDFIHGELPLGAMYVSNP